MEPCIPYQNTHHQLMVVIGLQQGKICWPFRFKPMSNINEVQLNVAIVHGLEYCNYN